MHLEYFALYVIRLELLDRLILLLKLVIRHAERRSVLLHGCTCGVLVAKCRSCFFAGGLSLMLKLPRAHFHLLLGTSFHLLIKFWSVSCLLD